jgi:hypothetical protein
MEPAIDRSAKNNVVEAMPRDTNSCNASLSEREWTGRVNSLDEFPAGSITR